MAKGRLAKGDTANSGDVSMAQGRRHAIPGGPSGHLSPITLRLPAFDEKNSRCGLLHSGGGRRPVGFRSSITDTRKQEAPDKT
jgi:hypothetical protein